MGVGMMLYLFKFSCPDISNSVREISKVADGATDGVILKHLYAQIKYVMCTKYFGLRLLPNINNDGFYLEGISDSKYAGDPNTLISVYGFVQYFCGAPISWKSKAAKSVTVLNHVLKLSNTPPQSWQRKFFLLRIC
jgi:hypothetical protein